MLAIYIFLIHNFIKSKKYKFKIIIVLSISLFFIFLYQSIRDNEGYAVTQDLPKSFYILKTYTYNDDILLLIKEKENSPRLYRLEKTLNLNKFLKKYKRLKKKGQDVVVKKNNPQDTSSLGMYIETIQKKLPSK